MSERPEVAILNTGVANIASVRAGLNRAGASTRFVEDAADVVDAEYLLFPGVGAFGAGMKRLEEAGYADALRQRFDDDRPTMAICLGLQLLFEGSAESPGVDGLGLVDGQIERFPDTVGVPQFGWNYVDARTSTRYLTSGHAYFANSYAAMDVPDGWQAAMARHGVEFVAAMERGQWLACQFHPEISGGWGQAIFERWLRGPRTTGAGRVTRRIIPCLDVRDGRVVKGVQFSGLRDAGSPVELADSYQLQGADELVVLDVSATPKGRAHQVETIEAIRSVLSIPLTVGGGVRSVDDAGRLLNAGADKVGVNTAAADRPEILTELAEQFGSQCTVVSIDARGDGDGSWEVVIRSGKEKTGLDAVEWAQKAAELGAGEILLTSWDRDGTRSGYDLQLLEAISNAVDVPVIASGGAANVGHLVDAFDAGADAVLAASIFHDGEVEVGELKDDLAEAGVEVRR